MVKCLSVLSFTQLVKLNTCTDRMMEVTKEGQIYSLGFIKIASVDEDKNENNKWVW